MIDGHGREIKVIQAPYATLIIDLKQHEFPWDQQYAMIEEWDYSDPLGTMRDDPEAMHVVTDCIKLHEINFEKFVNSRIEAGEVIREEYKIGISSKVNEVMKWPIEMAKQFQEHQLQENIYKNELRKLQSMGIIKLILTETKRRIPIWHKTMRELKLPVGVFTTLQIQWKTILARIR